MTRFIYALPAIALLAACGAAENAADTATEAATEAATNAVETVDAALTTLPAKFEGAASASYSLEKNHAFLYFTVSHKGLSDYRVNFTDFDATLDFDPVNRTHEANNISVTVNPMSVVTNYPGDYKAGHADSGFDSWDEDIARNERWLNGDAHPSISFTSTAIEPTGDYTGKVTGDLTLLGVTKPVTLDVTYRGTGNASWFGERDLIGFDAVGTFNRSDFGMGAFVPNIGDEVTVNFTGEFLQDE